MNRTTIIALLAAALLSPTWAFGQLGDTSDGAKAPWVNATGGAVEARSPGKMVQAGRARYEERHGFDIAHMTNGPQISDTESDRRQSILQETRAAMIRIVFENLTTFITAIDAAIQAGAIDGIGGSTSGSTGDSTGSSGDGGTSSSSDLSGLLGGPISGPAG